MSQSRAIQPLHPFSNSCETPGTQFRCKDCLHQDLYCAQCMCRNHSNLPMHRFEQWSGDCFQNVSSKALSYVFHLGHGSAPCSLGQDRPFTLGHTNGLHEISIRICRHPGRGDAVWQLLKAHIFPCSDIFPASGFTFTILRKFHLLSTEAKLSAQRFFNVLCALTNNVFPHLAPDRYKEFMRVQRQWEYLQDLKRAGRRPTERSSTLGGDLALRCPACPRMNYNTDPSDIEAGKEHLFVQHISYDGNFQLVRKNKAFDDWDICLSEGKKYFGDRDAFQAHLATIPKEVAEKRDKFISLEGLVESGLGSCIDARHGLFLPTGTVSFTKGERFSYTDFAIGCVLNRLLSEGIRAVGLHYDIMCHYERNLWSRFEKLEPPAGPLESDSFDEFISAVPKFHLAGHTENCFARYSLNNITGVG
ncbi:hypothetical protein BDV93DRAFT_534391 [Ceratobasidium sp. AG-I]|nr:hypothetical protein BDV93DRAFT_534391 [Ceratobasidium sp. AG-I]